MSRTRSAEWREGLRKAPIRHARPGAEQPGDEPAELVEWIEAERALIVVRLAAAVFGLVMVRTYDAEPYPPGYEAIGLALVALLACSTLPVVAVLRRVSTLASARTLALTTLVFDAAVVIGFVWLFAFDDSSVHFLLFFVLPAEAALKFRLPGAIAMWGACTAGYVGRAVWASERYGYDLNLPSISFRMGILLLVALVMGLFAQRLAAHSRDLHRALHRLDNERRWQSALIDMLAHDLRAPISTASSTLLLLEQRGPALDGDRLQELVRAASRQNQQALSLTDDLLELARSRQGRLELHREPVDLEAAVEEALAQLEESHDWAVVDVAGAGPAHVDPARLHQILVNLLSNARKHGRPPVEVSAATTDDGTVLRVSDHGDGLPEEFHEAVFEPLHSGPRADSVGLGLWIVHTLATAHGGTAAYETSDGRPTFVITLPHAGELSPAPTT